METAIEAIRAGAYDYLSKPFRMEEIRLVVRRALEQRRLAEENRRFRQELRERYRFENVVGLSPRMVEVYRLAARAAATDATVLIQGESGTGKELIARAIHYGSSRAEGPFVAVDCTALPEALFESEVFGHERGAFTGAVATRRGLLEVAQGGTVLLDEVGDLSPAVQAKLLRALQEREVRRVGAEDPIAVDLRIISATNRDLARRVAAGEFREDLYYRLSVVTITVPPLRERREDIPVLAQHFVRIYAAKNNRQLEGVADEALRRLEAYSWPGNVRELENVIERAVVLARGGRIELADLPPEIAGATPLPEGVLTIRIGTPLAEVTARLLEETLRVTRGNKTLTARLLGIDVRTVSRKLERQEDQLAEGGAAESAP
jgi:two-component system response regulator HydG